MNFMNKPNADFDLYYLILVYNMSVHSKPKCSISISSPVKQDRLPTCHLSLLTGLTNKFFILRNNDLSPSVLSMLDFSPSVLSMLKNGRITCFPFSLPDIPCCIFDVVASISSNGLSACVPTMNTGGRR